MGRARGSDIGTDLTEVGHRHALSATIDAAIADIVSAPNYGFTASYLAKTSGATQEEAEDALSRWVEAGRLRRKYEILCPLTGRTITSFAEGEAIPIGSEVECEYCDDEVGGGGMHIIERKFIWITFVAAPPSA